MNEKTLAFSGDMTAEVKIKDYFNDYAKQRGQYDGYVDTSISFAEKEKKINDLLMAEVKKLSGLDFSNSFASIEMMAKNPTFQWAYMAVIDAAIDMVLPDFVDRTTNVYTEMRNGAIGDSFKFDVESNDLFIVSKAGRNQRNTEFQREDIGQRSIIPFNHNISVSSNKYKALCGKESTARFLMKAVLSMEAELTKEIALAFATAMDDVKDNGAEALHVAGLADKSVIKLIQTVQAYNRAPAILMGTMSAVHDLLPQSANLRMMVDSDYVRVGYISNIYGTDVMVMPQYADYAAADQYKLALPDDKIYVISPSAQKPVKLCLEGATTSNTVDSNADADLTTNTTINKSWGIGVITNAIAGVITVS